MNNGISFVDNLLSRMTLEEKVAQLGAVHAHHLVENGCFSLSKAQSLLHNGIGQITRLAGDPDMEPRPASEIGNDIQRFLKEKTRLGIPAMIHEECLSGLTGRGATVFPQAIGMASTFHPELIEKITAVIRKQIRALGGHQGLAPVLDIPRDPRWGRTEETFGEDPYLVSRLAVAYIRGLQGDDLKTGVIATAKHFTAYGISEGGRNLAPGRVGERELREVFLFPFEAAIKEARAGSVMNAYHDIDGIPCTASHNLLTEVLREEWGFSGIVVSDYEAISMLETFHRVAQNPKIAACQALEAGIDVELPDIKCYGEPLLEAIREGLLSEEVLNESVRRILITKYLLGLFGDEIFVHPENVLFLLDTEEDRHLSREVACESCILLKNEGVLPLRRDLKSIAVIGPNAAEGLHLHGDYSYSVHIPSVQAWKGKEATWKEVVKTVNVLEGIQNKLPKAELLYVKGCDLSDPSKAGFAEALEAARKAEVIVAVMGEKSGLFQQSISGEGSDRSDIGLPGVQQELLKELTTLGKPVVLVLINGRPLALQWENENISAIIEAWYPGEEGGNAIADVLFGDFNPGGKLPISFPKEVGQIPVYYNRKRSSYNEYISIDARALFPFGHGLSYTRFEYSDLHIKPSLVKYLEKVEVQCKLKNAGERAGDEVVQLYIHDQIASLTRPIKELKGFQKVRLTSGEERSLTFTLFPEQLAFYDQNMRLIVEPGIFEVMIGSSSEDIRLTGRFEITEEKLLTKFRRFKSEITIR
ncbi:MAG TPA: glycoside hydrolase family 3 N-terminal domain-containing protein [Atribacteraceae bacterium]|nr:glycoside hydrolase family 3 N-terminal domain-containing protein [Atribacteraceae bacterium]